jgi:hypothetical protein
MEAFQSSLSMLLTACSLGLHALRKASKFKSVGYLQDFQTKDGRIARWLLYVIVRVFPDPSYERLSIQTQRVRKDWQERELSSRGAGISRTKNRLEMTRSGTARNSSRSAESKNPFTSAFSP